MKINWIKVFIIGIICSMLLTLTACMNQNKQKHIDTNNIKEVKKTINVKSNEEIIQEHITSFFKGGYSSQYNISNVKYQITKSIITDEKIEATIFVTMEYSVPHKDPDTVPYIAELKQDAQKETNPERKKMLQEQYETLANEYGKVQESHFIFKLTANLIDDKIDKKSIKLFVEQEGEKGAIYLDAEKILPNSTN